MIFYFLIHNSVIVNVEDCNYIEEYLLILGICYRIRKYIKRNCFDMNEDTNTVTIITVCVIFSLVF